MRHFDFHFQKSFVKRDSINNLRGTEILKKNKVRINKQNDAFPSEKLSPKANQREKTNFYF